MTKEEFIKQYGDVMVTFSSYYKYTFVFAADLPTGDSLSVSVGGIADDIYRFDVSANTLVRVSDLEPYAGSVRKDNTEVCGFYDP